MNFINSKTEAVSATRLGITLLLCAGACTASTDCTGLAALGVMAANTTYYAPYPIPPNDPRCSYYPDNRKACQLSGWLYYPLGPAKSGRLPAIVYNHGHDKERHEVCDIAKFFTLAGYVVFAPLRRGHYDHEINNTGTYLDDAVNQRVLQGADKNHEKVWQTINQVKEVAEALRFLRLLPMVDPDRIALMGHSFGGSLTVFAAGGVILYLGSGINLDPLPRAAISISGAALEWPDNSYWQFYLEQFVMFRDMPIFFLQPNNELSHKPTIFLSQVAATSGNLEFQAAFYPPVNPDAGECATVTDFCAGPGQLTNKEIHKRFLKDRTSSGGVNQVKIWGPTVLDFLQRYGVKP